MAKIYRIYTEDQGREMLIKVTGKHFESFTLQPTMGYFRGKPEKSVILEIVGARESAIKKLAREIGALNEQRTVLVMSLSGEAKKIKPRTS
jgi:hypothetical protein